MKLGLLFSGGKDSCLALHRAVAAGHEVACLLTLLPERDDSWMFHTPALEWTALQAEALELTGQTQEAGTVRLDSLGWARYGFGPDWAVRAKLNEISALRPARIQG